MYFFRNGVYNSFFIFYFRVFLNSSLGLFCFFLGIEANFVVREIEGVLELRDLDFWSLGVLLF